MNTNYSRIEAMQFLVTGLDVQPTIATSYVASAAQTGRFSFTHKGQIWTITAVQGRFVISRNQ